MYTKVTSIKLIKLIEVLLTLRPTSLRQVDTITTMITNDLLKLGGRSKNSRVGTSARADGGDGNQTGS